MKIRFFIRVVAVVMMTSLVSGCSRINKVFDNEGAVGYTKAGTVTPLEIPPDLTTPEFDPTFEVQSGASHANAGRSKLQVLPGSSEVTVKGSGAVRWLEVTVPASTLWSKVRSFWTVIGTDLKRNEPAVGIMETNWIEARSDLPRSGIQKVLGNLLKSATDTGFRDRYTTRFEKLSANTTRIFITHRGAELMVTDTGSKWEKRPRSVSAEAEMLNRLKAYLQGVDPKTVTGSKAKPASGAATSGAARRYATLSVKNKRPVLNVRDSYTRVWVRTGSALTQTGFALEGQDSQQGRYAVLWQQEAKKKKSFFKRLVSRENKFLVDNTHYLIHVSKSGNGSQLRVTSKSNKVINNNVAEKILVRVMSEFNR